MNLEIDHQLHMMLHFNLLGKNFINEFINPEFESTCKDEI